MLKIGFQNKLIFKYSTLSDIPKDTCMFSVHNISLWCHESMFDEATFWEMLCPLLGKVSGYVAHIYSKYTGLREEFRYFLLFHIVAPPLHNLNKYLAYTPKACVKDECNNAKNSTTFSNYIRNICSEDDEIIVSFDVTCTWAFL